MRLTVAEVCARAEAFERQNLRGYWILLLLALPLAAGFVHNAIRLSETWTRLGTVYVGGIFIYIMWRLLRRGPASRRRLVSQAEEPCVEFLRREMANKREALQWIRRLVWLIFPGMVATWWGGGPRHMSRLLGITSPAYLRFQESPWLPAVWALMLAFLWFAFGREAQKVEREMRLLGRD